MYIIYNKDKITLNYFADFKITKAKQRENPPQQMGYIKSKFQLHVQYITK